jgi:hypothetical protein
MKIQSSQDHVLNRRLGLRGLDGIDLAVRQTHQSITSVLLELGRDLVGRLDHLIFNGESADD